MTPDEMAAEIETEPGRALALVAEAKGSSHRPPSVVPPLLNAMKVNGSTLQVSGPPWFDRSQETEVAVRLIRLAQAFGADHSALACDSLRDLAADVSDPEMTFESTASATSATPFLLVQSYDVDNGSRAIALPYSVDENGEAKLAAAGEDVPRELVANSLIAQTMEATLGRTDVIGPASLDAELATADSDQYGVFLIEQEPDVVHVRVWGNNQREEYITKDLPAGEITLRIQDIFAASRLRSLDGGVE